MFKRTLLILLCAIALCGPAAAQAASEIAPNGILRVALLLSNGVLVTKSPDGSFSGVAVDLGRMIAGKLGARYAEVTYTTTESYAASFGKNEWDIAVGPKTPITERTSDLTDAFMLVDNIYVAAPGRSFKSADEVDAPDVRIAVVVNGAPDQFLSKALKRAKLVRVAGATAEIVETLQSGKADVYGSNAENVHAAAAKLPGSTIVPGAFRTVSMVIASPKGKSASAQQTLQSLVAEAKSSGLVRKAIDRQQIKGVRVPP